MVFGRCFEGSPKDFWFWQLLRGAQDLQKSDWYQWFTQGWNKSLTFTQRFIHLIRFNFRDLRNWQVMAMAKESMAKTLREIANALEIRWWSQVSWRKWKFSSPSFQWPKCWLALKTSSASVLRRYYRRFFSIWTARTWSLRFWWTRSCVLLEASLSSGPSPRWGCSLWMLEWGSWKVKEKWGALKPQVCQVRKAWSCWWPCPATQPWGKSAFKTVW